MKIRQYAFENNLVDGNQLEVNQIYFNPFASNQLENNLIVFKSSTN
jgi:hypothetical protein